MMRFSIITVTYNAEKYLFETLESVASQTFKDYEHILWDGGSSDQTLKIASRFSHLKIVQGKDHGVSDAMNKGAGIARGDFLLFLHADDRLSRLNVLETVDTCLKQHPHVQWLFGLADIIDEHGKKKRTTPFIPFNQAKLRKYNIITHPATYISRELFFQIGGFADYKYCMDYDLWLRLSERTKINAFSLSTTLACFREHENSLSTREKLAVTDEAYSVRNRYVRTLSERWKSYRTWKKRRKKESLH
jgi:glycosyltransferase involved in cell wall biosynthesis